MSTIEEAREQARAAQEQISNRLIGSRLGLSSTREMDKDMLALSNGLDALSALLDATEPPRAAVCEWCPASARGTAWHNDGRLHLSCGQIDHGQGWVPDEPAAILATDLATEPPAHDEACEADWGPEGQESPCRCGEWRPSDSCPHENFTSLHSGLGMVRMTCHDCGETVEAISATAQDDIEERSTR